MAGLVTPACRSHYAVPRGGLRNVWLEFVSGRCGCAAIRDENVGEDATDEDVRDTGGRAEDGGGFIEAARSKRGPSRRIERRQTSDPPTIVTSTSVHPARRSAAALSGCAPHALRSLLIPKGTTAGNSQRSSVDVNLTPYV